LGLGKLEGFTHKKHGILRKGIDSTNKMYLTNDRPDVVGKQKKHQSASSASVSVCKVVSKFRSIHFDGWKGDAIDLFQAENSQLERSK